MSPDVLLSRLGLRYDGTGLQGTPAQIVSRLVTLANAIRLGTYQTANFVPAPVTPATFDPRNVQKEQAAMQAYLESLQTGLPAKVHRAVDAVNKIRMVKSGTELIPPTNFDILAHQQTPLGEAARWLIAEEMAGAANFWLPANLSLLRKYTRD